MAKTESLLPYVPTGYENVAGTIARNKQIADALTQAGLVGPQGATHGMQALGTMAQALVGGLVNRRVQSDEAGLRSASYTDERKKLAALTDALAQGVAPQDIIGAFGGSQPPAVQRIVNSIIESEQKRRELSMEKGSPTIMLGPDGTRQTVQLDKAGGITPVQGFRQPEEITNVNGVATALQAQQPGAVLPQNLTDSVIRGPMPDNAMINPLALGAKVQVASAGRPTTSINTAFNVDTLGALAKVLPGNQIAGLDADRQIAEAYIKAAPGLARATEAANNPMITGAFANVRLNALKAADLLGISGKTEQERISNTENFVREQMAGVLPILQALRPASDTDVKTAQKIVAGDTTLSLGAIQSALRAAKADGDRLIARHNRRVDDLAKLYGRQAPDAALSIQSYRVLPDGGAAAAPRRGKYNPATGKVEY